MADPQHPAWLWDVDLDAATFAAILAGRRDAPPFDRPWAVLRLIEYAPYAEIKRLLPRPAFLELWPALAPKVRSASRRAGMEFVFQWLNAQADPHA